MKEREGLAEKPGQTECKVIIVMILRNFLTEVMVFTAIVCSSCLDFVLLHIFGIK